MIVMFLLTCILSLFTDSVGCQPGQALYAGCVLLQVRAHLHIEDTMYLVLTSIDGDLTSLDLGDHWQELPHLNKLDEYFEELAEQLSISMPRKQLALTQADLVCHAPHNLGCLSCSCIYSNMSANDHSAEPWQ